MDLRVKWNFTFYGEGLPHADEYDEIALLVFGELYFYLFFFTEANSEPNFQLCFPFWLNYYSYSILSIVVLNICCIKKTHPVIKTKINKQKGNKQCFTNIQSHSRRISNIVLTLLLLIVHINIQSSEFSLF